MTSGLNAQVIPDSSRVPFVCSYYGEDIPSNITSFKSGSEAQEIISRILSVIGLHQNFDIRAANVPNAAAVIYGRKRLILYNSKFINSINNATGNDWAGISILAHEIGHHLNGHTLTATGSRPDIELEADEFSGFVLRKMGAALTDAQAAMSIAASARASHTHPAKKDRLKAIAAGWQNANDQVTGNVSPKKTDKEIEKPVTRPAPEPDQAVLDEKFIAYDVHFNADPAGRYYVTIRNNLVKVDGSDLYIAGRLALSNKKGFKYMFYDKQYNYLYINTKGVIVNGIGKKVGTLKKRA
jgi:hypothetical protein